MVFSAKVFVVCQMTCLVFVLSGCGSSSSSGSGSGSVGSGSAPGVPAATAQLPAGPTSPIVAPATPATPAAPPTAGTTPVAPATPVAGAANNALVTATNNGNACLPNSMPSADTLFKSTKKVFAHYFYPYPRSIDNHTPAADYYNEQYLNSHGESNKWLNQGGLLRQRPLAVAAPNSDPHWQQTNMQREVSAAIARGIVGFAFDVMSVDEATDPQSHLHLMLDAAQAVDSRFKIIVMPDMTVFGADMDEVVRVIASVADSPAAYRLADGRLVVSPFAASANSAAWWSSVIAQLKAQGIDIAFVPTFLGWTHYADQFASISYGFGDWGSATAGGSSLLEDDAGIAHTAYQKLFMLPVDPQQYRPKNFVYWEAANSSSLRAGWTSAIRGNADWVQLVTWNDLSETSAISPYTDSTLDPTIGTGYYNLSGYYAAWFATGHEPTVSHDVLYYFYRREPTHATVSAQTQTAAVTGGVAENNIELLAFLTAPGQLKIEIGGKTYTKDASAGMVSFKVPTQPGKPIFTLSRNGSAVFSFQGRVQIVGMGGLPSGIQDLTYWSGSASQTGVCAL
jgi:hypothetical protein